MNIKANTITVDDGSPVVIGFTDDERNPLNYLLLQYDPTEKGTPLHIEINDQMQSGYNLVKRIQLLDSSVLVELNDNGEKALKSGSMISVSITSAIQNWDTIRSKLSTLLQQWV